MTSLFDHEPWIKKVDLKLTPPSLKDNTADTDRLIKGVKKSLKTEKVHINLSLIKRLPHLLRESNYDVHCVLFEEDDVWQLTNISSARPDALICGLAVDLGTSTIVIRLLDLLTGKALGETTFLNPQVEIGTDILTRIHFTREPSGLERLQGVLIERLNQKIIGLCKTHDVDVSSIVGAAVAGNTTMTHLFLGLDPYWICREPYIPVLNNPGLLTAKESGLGVMERAPVLIMPGVGSYLGGDLIAGVLASGLYQQKEPSILVDVGTNAEVVLGNDEWLMACAGAAGPALEGGVASMGMQAAPGVIDKFMIEPRSKAFQIRTIDHKPPIGICGSGLIDLVAFLFLANMIDMRGKYVPDQCGKRLVVMDGIEHLVVVTESESGTGKALTLSQPDIDSLLRSKAAMYTILTTIADMVSISLKDLSRFYIAGTFGAYIDPRSAITLGMLPDLPIQTYVPLGNTSLEGACMALLSSKARQKAYEIRDRITYIELNVNQEFMNHFSAARFIPHTNRSLFPSVKEWRILAG
ncbi:MAG: DUF4445 domain-containing protein [Deltaproteobacteria bacterium]|nr:DUF4445 domain-containing protein [Deltaproteobacteria bacterium]